MYAMMLTYLVLVLLFLVAGVGVWILRGYGFSEFRRSGRTTPPTEAGSREQVRP